MVQNPIFIGGLAHSGKTLLRLMLLTLPHLSISRKTKMWDRFYDAFGDLSQPSRFDRCLAALLQDKQIQRFEPDADRIRHVFKQGAPSYARLFALFHAQYAERLGKTRWGEQLGFVERLADPIFAAFPEAKMIHMIRDPRDRDTAVKATTQHRRGKTGWTTASWIYSAGLTWRNQQRYPNHYLVVRYESLMNSPEKTLRQICEFLGEAFVPDMLAVLDKKRDTAVAAPTPSPTLSKQEIAFTQAYARQHMLAFDYPLIKPQFSLRDRLMFYFIDWPANRTSMAVWDIFRARSIGKYLRS
jgi:hypothetical protein